MPGRFCRSLELTTEDHADLRFTRPCARALNWVCRIFELCTGAITTFDAYETYEKFRAVDASRKRLQSEVDLARGMVREPVTRRARHILPYGQDNVRCSFSKAMQSIILKQSCQRFSGAR